MCCKYFVYLLFITLQYLEAIDETAAFAWQASQLKDAMVRPQREKRQSVFRRVKEQMEMEEIWCSETKELWPQRVQKLLESYTPQQVSKEQTNIVQV